MFLYGETGSKLEGDMGDIVSLKAQMSPFFQLREKLKCIEHIDKSEAQLKSFPEIRKSEQNFSQFQITSVMEPWRNMTNYPKFIPVTPFSSGALLLPNEY